MKKICYILFVLLMFNLTSCTLPNKYEAEGGIWYCEELNMSIDISTLGSKAQIYKQNGVIDTYKCLIDFGDKVTITKTTWENAYLFGKIDYKENYFTITTDEKEYVFVCIDGNDKQNEMINYTFSQKSFDFYDDEIAVLQKGNNSNMLKIADSNNHIEYLERIGEVFRLLDDYVIHIKKDDLYITSRSDANEMVVDRDVQKFSVYKDKVIYLTKYEENEEKNSQVNELIVYDIEDYEYTMIRNNVDNFYVHDDKLYIFYEYHNAYPAGEKEVNIISLKNYKTREKIGLPYMWLSQVSPLGAENILCYIGGDFHIYNLKNLAKKHQVVPGIDTPESGHNSIAYAYDIKNANKERLYVSFQANKYDAGELKSCDSEKNGLWTINMYTGEQNKLNDVFFEELCIYKEKMFGVSNDNLYSINMETGELEIICKM